MTRIQSTGSQRQIAIALTSLGLAVPAYSYFLPPSGAFSIGAEAAKSIQLRFQAEFKAFVAELDQSDAAMQEAQHRFPQSR